MPNDISQTNNITAAVYRVRRERKKYFIARSLRPHLAAVCALTDSNIAEVAAQGVASAAVITAITEAEQPAQACQALLALFEEGRRNINRHNLPRRARPTLL